MKYDIQTRLYRLAVVLEVIVGIVICLAIAVSVIGLFGEIHPGRLFASPETLSSYLSTAMTIIIGIEFVKMIFSHTLDSVVEVMLLAIARQMIIEHTTPLENLCAVAAVALLFVVRKFLFVRKLDEMPDQPDSLLQAILHGNREPAAEKEAAETAEVRPEHAPEPEEDPQKTKIPIRDLR